jgi:glucan biosynthesis protein C
METEERLHAMDHLRALAMLTGVGFHAALAYSPLMQPWFPTADRQTWWGVDALIWLPHLVRMPLFFVVAGFFAAWVLQRRGIGGMLRQRVRRILLPLLAAWPLVHLTTSALTLWAATELAHPSPMLLMVREWLALPDPPPMPPSTGHLWFLYYLLWFSVLYWVGRTLEFGALLQRWMALPPRRGALALALLLVPSLAQVSAPHPAPESLLPQAWAFGFYGPFFALGVSLHGRMDWLDRLRPDLARISLACLALYAIFLWRLSLEPPGAEQPTASWLVAALEAGISASGTLVCLLAGRIWLDRPVPLLRYLSASAYWTYLLHLPLLFALQYAMMDWPLAWPLKFVLATGLTLGICLLSHEWLVRRTPLRHYVG